MRTHQARRGSRLAAQAAAIFAAGIWIASPFARLANAGEAPTPVADRAAIERVYHAHRTGTKVPFEQAVPTALLEELVRVDAKKEAVLARVYGVKVTPEMVAAEVQRINTTTRAPEMLAEIKAALGNDSARFARTMARPIVVERLLRDKFENDDSLQAPQRRAAESTRERLLAAKARGLAAQSAALKDSKDGEVQERVRWELTARPVEKAPSSTFAAPAATQSKTTGGIYSNEATAQIAQALSAPEKLRDETREKFYFEDLPGDLQNVLRAQLRAPGDVSAVIESARAFQIYIAREHTEAALIGAVVSIPKRSYENWLAEQ